VVQEYYESKVKAGVLLAYPYPRSTGHQSRLAHSRSLEPLGGYGHDFRSLHMAQRMITEEAIFGRMGRLNSRNEFTGIKFIQETLEQLDSISWRQLTSQSDQKLPFPTILFVI